MTREDKEFLRKYSPVEPLEIDLELNNLKKNSMEVDFSDLRLPVGRPAEDPMEERKDLTKYILEQKFSKRWSAFFLFWEKVIIRKAIKTDNPKYISYMEEFYGEVLAKFQELSDTKQRIVSTSEYPIKQLYEFTNLSEPNLFNDLKDNEEFLEVLKTEKL